MSDNGATADDKPRRSFRTTLVSVLTVQVLTLLALWWLQTYYST